MEEKWFLFVLLGGAVFGKMGAADPPDYGSHQVAPKLPHSRPERDLAPK